MNLVENLSDLITRVLREQEVDHEGSILGIVRLQLIRLNLQI